MSKKYYIVLVLVGLLGATLLWQRGTHQARAAVSNWHKGITITPSWSGEYDTANFRASIDSAAATGVNFVTLIIPLYQSNNFSTDIQNGGNTPTDQALAAGIGYIHSKGLKVSLKIHLETFTGEWRAFINPSDRAAWFANFQSKLLHFGWLAQQNAVEDFCVGAELINMAAATSNPSNTQNWKNMIAAMRAVFTGKLTYSANWGGGGFTDEKNHIEFWNVLDYIGISAYYNLNTDNQVQNLKNAWAGYNSADITPLQQRWNKPIIFTEIGYKSVPNSHTRPWDYSIGGGPDMVTQQNAYQALFEYWNTQAFMQGVDLWDWKSDPNAGGTGNTDYTPQNKPAQAIMKTWFGGSVTPSPTPTPTPTPPPTVTCGAPGSGSFTGCYYNTTNFTNPVLTRTDTALNFDWGNGSPDPKVPSDGFSAKWEGNFNFAAGTYTFTATADDGVRVYVDGVAVIDQWQDQPPTTYTAAKSLTAGTHAVKVEYYENGGGAVAKLSWTQSGNPPPAASCGAPGSGSFTGCYYSGQTFGTFVLGRNDAAINFDWSNGSPDPKVPADGFSVRWQGNFSFSAATYTFTATADDGIRVWVDNTLIINQWQDQPPTTVTASLPLSSGQHAVKVEYYENGGGAVAKVSWTQNVSPAPSPSPTLVCPSPSSVGFTGCYYNDKSMTALGLVRTDSNINFDWGSGSPDPKINSDSFSAKWEGSFTFAAGTYVFSATADDGVRVYVDGVAVIDQWQDQGPTTYTSSRSLSAGSHMVRMEYYENGGGAVAKLSWAQSGSSQPPPPPPSSSSIEIWWPTNSSTVSGTQPFKAILSGQHLGNYKMYWQVDGGQLVEMYDAGDHKEFWVDVSPWTWNGTGPYTVTFAANSSSGTALGSKSIQIFVSK